LQVGFYAVDMVIHSGVNVQVGGALQLSVTDNLVLESGVA
jgi:hypothetical protein